LSASIVFGIAGQLLMKRTMSSTAEGLLTWAFFQQLILAIGTYSLGVINWIFALRFVKLSVAYPLTSLNYVGILLGSYYFFNENITPTRVAGVFLVFVGVLFVVLPVRTSKSKMV
jgi:drug/metabolite transporter (DMT)-like permease